MPRRIYQATLIEEDRICILDQAASHHVQHVLRMQVGDELVIFDGLGHEYEALIEGIHKKTISVHVKKRKSVNRESSLKLHLAQAISRAERMDYTIQKATELGVTSITPLLTERCQIRLTADRWEKKQAHWQSIAISACEQSGRNIIPSIHPVVKIEDWLGMQQYPMGILLDPMADRDFSSIPQANEICLLIGSEGGFTQQEVDAAMQKKFLGLRLGPRVLRTETAAVVAMSILQYEWGDL